MCKEMLVIPVDRVVDKKRIIGKWRAEKEERHKGSLTYFYLFFRPNGSRQFASYFAPRTFGQEARPDNDNWHPPLVRNKRLRKFFPIFPEGTMRFR
jgi:hypothetical protein